MRHINMATIPKLIKQAKRFCLELFYCLCILLWYAVLYRYAETHKLTAMVIEKLMWEDK